MLINYVFHVSDEYLCLSASALQLQQLQMQLQLERQQVQEHRRHLERLAMAGSSGSAGSTRRPQYATIDFPPASGSQKGTNDVNLGLNLASLLPRYPFIYPCIHLSIYLAVHSSIDLSFNPSIDLSVYPSIHTSIYDLSLIPFFFFF